MGHVSKTTPILGVICHPFGKTYSFVQNLRALPSAIPEIDYRKRVHRNNVQRKNGHGKKVYTKMKKAEKTSTSGRKHRQHIN